MARRETFTGAGDAAAGYQQPRHEGTSPSLMCAVSGCPMPGTLSDAISGEVSRRYCRFHFGAAYGDNATITAKLKNRATLVHDELAARRKGGGREAFLRLDHAMTTDKPFARSPEAVKRSRDALDALLGRATTLERRQWAYDVLVRSVERPASVTSACLDMACEAMRLDRSLWAEVRKLGTDA